MRQQQRLTLLRIAQQLTTRAPAHSGSSSGVFVKETRLVRLINEIYDARQDDASSAETCVSALVQEGGRN